MTDPERLASRLTPVRKWTEEPGIIGFMAGLATAGTIALWIWLLT